MLEPCQAHVTLNAIGVGTLWCMSCTEVYHAGSLFSSNNCVTFSLCCSLTRANTIIFSWPCASFSCPPQAEQGEMWACVSVCVSVIVCVNVCVCVWVYVHVCVCVCVCACVMHAYLCLCGMYACVYIYTCMCVNTHACVCMCMCSCVCVCVCIRNFMCVFFFGGWGGYKSVCFIFCCPKISHLCCQARRQQSETVLKSTKNPVFTQEEQALHSKKFASDINCLENLRVNSLAPLALQTALTGQRDSDDHWHSKSRLAAAALTASASCPSD